jgi:putative ABC transport system ATP-binding protein
VALIEIERLKRRYPNGVLALNGLDLEVEEGEWLTLTGPSGSGKTTLLNVISGLDRPSSGSVRVAGVEISELDQNARARFRREHIGLIFQHYHLIPHLTALENVMLAQYFHSMVDETEAQELLARVGLADRLDHLPSQLSGGERQRVCIARALINEPILLLADEPTANLDPESAQTIYDLFRRLHQEGHTIIMVTHEREGIALGDRVVRLSEGKIKDVRCLVHSI